MIVRSYQEVKCIFIRLQHLCEFSISYCNNFYVKHHIHTYEVAATLNPMSISNPAVIQLEQFDWVNRNKCGVVVTALPFCLPSFYKFGRIKKKCKVGIDIIDTTICRTEQTPSKISSNRLILQKYILFVWKEGHQRPIFCTFCVPVQMDCLSFVCSKFCSNNLILIHIFLFERYKIIPIFETFCVFIRLTISLNLRSNSPFPNSIDFNGMALEIYNWYIVYFHLYNFRSAFF